jgi:PAS domain S-box-containing protein
MLRPLADRIDALCSRGMWAAAPLARLPRLLRDLDSDLRLLLSVILIVVLALGVAIATIREAENRLLKSEAAGAAVHWAEFLQTRLHDLDEILAAGLVSEKDRQTLDFAGAAGRVRDYQVIRPDGIVAMSSWSGDFRGTIDPETVLSVIRDDRTLAQVIEDSVAGERLVIGQAYVPLTSGGGRRGALKVDVDMTSEAMRYRSIGNGAFALLIGLLLPPGGACGWLIHRNFRRRRQGEELQRQRGQVLEDLAKGAPLEDVLHRIATYAEQHQGSGRCTILALDSSGRQLCQGIGPAARGSPGSAAGGADQTWSTSLRATSGTPIGRFELSCATGKAARAAGLGPAGILAQLAALAIERHQAENAFADIRQRNELILSAAGDGIFGIDAEARVTFANPAAARMLGRDAVEMIGLGASALVKIRASDPGPACPIAATLRDGRSRHAENICMRRGDGGEFPAELMITPVRRQASDLRAVVVFHDISAQIDAQRQLLAARDQAEMANRSKSSFLAHMSHELRTPLNAIIGFSEVIARQVMGPIANAHYHDYAADIHASGQHLLSLINDLLDLSKIEAGKLELFEETVDLHALVKRCAVFVNEALRAKQLELQLDIAPGLTAVFCDERRLKQVLLNLLSNAIKFTAKGRISVAARRDGADLLRIEVADTGVGIAAKDIAKAMTPFGQVDGTLSREHKGTGLGLPLAKQLIELHGGTLALASETGRGTKITILLPGRAGPQRSAHLPRPDARLPARA